MSIVILTSKTGIGFAASSHWSYIKPKDFNAGIRRHIEEKKSYTVETFKRPRLAERGEKGLALGAGGGGGEERRGAGAD